MIRTTTRVTNDRGPSAKTLHLGVVLMVVLVASVASMTSSLAALPSESAAVEPSLRSVPVVPRIAARALASDSALSGYRSDRPERTEATRCDPLIEPWLRLRRARRAWHSVFGPPGSVQSRRPLASGRLQPAVSPLAPATDQHAADASRLRRWLRQRSMLADATRGPERR